VGDVVMTAAATHASTTAFTHVRIGPDRRSPSRPGATDARAQELGFAVRRRMRLSQRSERHRVDHDGGGSEFPTTRFASRFDAMDSGVCGVACTSQPLDSRTCGNNSERTAARPRMPIFEFALRIWRRRPDLNRASRFCRF